MKQKKLNLEDIFLSALKSNTILQWYLQWNIDVVEYLDAKWPTYMKFVEITFAFIPKKRKLEMFNDFNKSRILKTLEIKRPDLYKTINTEEGLRWMDDQIFNFRGRFL